MSMSEAAVLSIAWWCLQADAYGSFTNSGVKGSGDGAGSLVSSKEGVDNGWLQLERNMLVRWAYECNLVSVRRGLGVCVLGRTLG